jgi:hypothetical protein
MAIAQALLANSLTASKRTHRKDAENAEKRNRFVSRGMIRLAHVSDPTWARRIMPQEAPQAIVPHFSAFSASLR